MKVKICRGPLHPPGGSLVPLTDYTFNKSGERAGKPLSRCKYCRSSGNAKTVPAYVFMPLIEELFEKYKLKEISQITNLDRNLVRDLKKGKRKRINKKTFLSLHRAVARIPKEKSSIGPSIQKTKRNGLNSLGYEERILLKNLVSKAQKNRYKKDKALLKHVL